MGEGGGGGEDRKEVGLMERNDNPVGGLWILIPRGSPLKGVTGSVMEKEGGREERVGMTGTQLHDGTSSPS